MSKGALWSPSDGGTGDGVMAEEVINYYVFVIAHILLNMQKKNILNVEIENRKRREEKRVFNQKIGTAFLRFFSHEWSDKRAVWFSFMTMAQFFPSHFLKKMFDVKASVFLSLKNNNNNNTKQQLFYLLDESNSL